MRIRTQHNSSTFLKICLSLVLIFAFALAHAAPPSPSAAGLKSFTEAQQSGDIQTLLAVFHRIGQNDTKEAATDILYAGLSKQVLAELSEEDTQQVLATAREVLEQMAEKKSRKVAYKATSKHPNWRVRAMLLDMAIARIDAEKRALTAVLRAINDHTDAVSLRAIEVAGDMKLKKAVPKLMNLVIDKWGQHVGVGAAKATVALEKITGTAKPADWHRWVSQNL